MKLKLAVTLFAISACALFLINSMNFSPASTGFRGLQDVADSAPADDSASVDASAPADSSATVDASAPADSDSGSDVDASAPADSSAPVDASAPADSDSGSDVDADASVDAPALDDSTPPSFVNITFEGIGKLVQDLVLASNSSSSAFDALSINVINQSGTDEGIVYEGELTISNDQNVTLSAQFSGLYDASNNRITLFASDNDTANSTDDDEVREDGYNDLPLTATNDDGVIQNALAYGIQAVVEAGISQNQIPSTSPDYTVASISSVGFKANDSLGIWIRFIVGLQNSLNNKVDTNMTVYYDNSDSSYQLSYYEYTSYSNSPTTGSEVDPTNSTNPTVPARADGYTDLPLTATNDHGVIQNALAYGIQAVIETGVSQNKIPNASLDYTVASLSSVGYKANGDVGIWVRFIISLQNTLKYKVDTNITVFYRNSNSSYKLSYYKYKSYNWPSSALPSVPAANNTGNATNQTQPSSPTNSSAASNSTAPASADNYIALGWDQVALSQQIHGALDFGIYNVIQKGLSQNKIPAASPDYAITQNITASYLTKSKGVSYNFHVALQNSLKYKVDINATVLFKSSDSSYSLTAYSFASSGYPAKALTTSSPSTSGTVASTTSAPANGGN